MPSQRLEFPAPLERRSCPRADMLVLKESQSMTCEDKAVPQLTHSHCLSGPPKSGNHLIPTYTSLLATPCSTHTASPGHGGIVQPLHCCRAAGSPALYQDTPPSVFFAKRPVWQDDRCSFAVTLQGSIGERPARRTVCSCIRTAAAPPCATCPPTPCEQGDREAAAAQVTPAYADG